MYHTGTAKLEPSRFTEFAFITINFAGTIADTTGDIYFKLWFRELEMEWSQSYFSIFTKELLGEIIDSAF